MGILVRNDTSLWERHRCHKLASVRSMLGFPREIRIAPVTACMNSQPMRTKPKHGSEQTFQSPRGHSLKLPPRMSIRECHTSGTLRQKDRKGYPIWHGTSSQCRRNCAAPSGKTRTPHGCFSRLLRFFVTTRCWHAPRWGMALTARGAALQALEYIEREYVTNSARPAQETASWSVQRALLRP